MRVQSEEQRAEQMEQEVENNDLSASSPNKTGTNWGVQKSPANGDFMRLRPKSRFPASEPDHRSPSCEFLGQEESAEVKRWKERGKSSSVRARTPVEPPGWEFFLVYRALPVGTAGRLGRNRRRGGPSRPPPLSTPQRWCARKINRNSKI